MKIKDLRKGDLARGVNSGKEILCIKHHPLDPKHGEVWMIKLIFEDMLQIIYDSYDSWEYEVELISSGNNVEQYQDL